MWWFSPQIGVGPGVPRTLDGPVKIQYKVPRTSIGVPRRQRTFDPGRRDSAADDALTRACASSRRPVPKRESMTFPPSPAKPTSTATFVRECQGRDAPQRRTSAARRAGVDGRLPGVVPEAPSGCTASRWPLRRRDMTDDTVPFVSAAPPPLVDVTSPPLASTGTTVDKSIVSPAGSDMSNQKEATPERSIERRRSFGRIKIRVVGLPQQGDAGVTHRVDQEAGGVQRADDGRRKDGDGGVAAASTMRAGDGVNVTVPEAATASGLERTSAVSPTALMNLPTTVP